MNPHHNATAAAARYRGIQVKTCSPIQLLVMMYDGAIRFTFEAETAMSQNDRARAGERIGRAHAVIEELAATLEPEKAPELAENLLAIYAFAMRRLIEANLQQDRAKLNEVVAALTPLREAYATLAEPR